MIKEEKYDLNYTVNGNKIFAQNSKELKAILDDFHEHSLTIADLIFTIKSLLPFIF